MGVLARLVLSRKEHTNFAFLSHSRWVKRFISSQPPRPIPSSYCPRPRRCLFLRLRWINGTRSFAVFLFLLLSYDLLRCPVLSPPRRAHRRQLSVRPRDRLFFLPSPAPPLIYLHLYRHRDGCFVLKLSAPRWIVQIFNYLLYERSHRVHVFLNLHKKFSDTSPRI